MNYEEHDSQEMEAYIARMQTIAVRLRLLGMGMLIATMMNLACAFAVAVRSLQWFIILQVSAMLFVMVVFLAMLFEQLRRRGEIIYEEVTDDLHRFYRETEMDRPRIAFRIALKNFATAMDLPLVPGRYGVSLYILLNLAVLVFAFLTHRA